MQFQPKSKQFLDHNRDPHSNQKNVKCCVNEFKKQFIPHLDYKDKLKRQVIRRIYKLGKMIELPRNCCYKVFLGPLMLGQKMGLECYEVYHRIVELITGNS